jgi:hypothetical protein
VNAEVAAESSARAKTAKRLARADDDRLVRAIAEQLKMPLLQIARSAELAETTRKSANETISIIADSALRLIDGFLLSSDRKYSEVLQLEPVSISSVLADAAHKLSPMAVRQGCDIEVRLAGRYGPVMAHKESLESAMILLGYSLIEARDDKAGNRHELILAAHRSVSGLVTGVFDNRPGMTRDMFRRGRALYGHAHQTMPAFSGANGAGIFVADALLRTMAAPLHTARHNKLSGLAATFHPSSQMRLV